MPIKKATLRDLTLILRLIVIILVIIWYFLREEPNVPSSKIENPVTESTQTLGILDNAKLETATVNRVVDGDTIELSDKRKVRYIGIDTPEVTNTPECYAQQAKEKNVTLVEGKQIQMEKDVSETDRYGRLLRYVYVDNVMVNLSLVEEGFATAATFPPDVKYKDLFLEAQKRAEKENVGLWGDTCQY